MAITSWRRQEAEKQMRARAANDTAARRLAGTPAGQSAGSFVCECGDRGCTCAIALTLEQYASVRASATQFVIAPDHENPESERVIVERARFAVIETLSPEATKLARRSDPRWGREQVAGPLPDKQEGTTRGRRPRRALDRTSVDKRRRSGR